MVSTTYKTAIEEKLERLTAAFTPILYEDDREFLRNMETHSLAGDDIRRYEHWEWTQGVGLYGLWKLLDATETGSIWTSWSGTTKTR